ncbi:MAG: methyltransferase domain-containing protein [Pseudonocardiaceae bacterium]
MIDASVLVAKLNVTSPWRAAFGAVPRHVFLPRKSWVPDEHGEMVPIDRDQDIERWLELAYSDIYFVTQVDDGATVWPADGKASSSSSMPSVMLTMLDALDVTDGTHVLEIGTGTGYNAAILSHRVGVDRVTTVEVDPGVAATAASNLAIAGHPVSVVCGDGAMGYPRGAPYDRVLVTCAVIGEVPYSWVEQTSPGGLVVAPWGTPYKRSALLRLRVSEDGTACGRFVKGVYLSFMSMRAQRMECLPDAPDREPDEITTTALGPAELRHTALVFDASFAIGLRVPECRTWYETDDGHGYWHTIGFADAESGSFAILDADPNEPDIVIKQWGPRRLWDEVEVAYQWWVSEGRPSHDRFGISVGPGGQLVWLDDPSRPVLMA